VNKFQGKVCELDVQNIPREWSSVTDTKILATSRLFNMKQTLGESVRNTRRAASVLRCLKL